MKKIQDGSADEPPEIFEVSHGIWRHLPLRLNSGDRDDGGVVTTTNNSLGAA